MTRLQTISVRQHSKIVHAQWARDRHQRLFLIAARARAQAVRRTHASNRRQLLPSPWMTHAELQALNCRMGFEPLSNADKDRLETEPILHCSDDVFDRKVCVVTDAWVFPSDAVRIRVADMPFAAMQAVLTGGPWCTPSITDYYDCSSFHPRLHGLLLSCRASEHDPDNQLHVWFSKRALSHLRKLQARVAHAIGTVADLRPPRFAIADCFMAGTFDAIDELTVIERQAVALAQIRGVVKVVYGGPGNVLHSHLLCWDNRSATISSSIPAVVGREFVQKDCALLETPSQMGKSNNMHTTNVIVQAFEHALRDLTFQESEITPRSIRPLASIREVSDYFQLNRR